MRVVLCCLQESRHQPQACPDNQRAFSQSRGPCDQALPPDHQTACGDELASLPIKCLQVPRLQAPLTKTKNLLLILIINHPNI